MSKRFLNQGSMTLTVTNTEFVDNTALNRNARGGAIFLTDGNITVAGCTFMNNTADTYGGAIFLGRVFNAEVRMVEATITQSRFIDNRANNVHFMHQTQFASVRAPSSITLLNLSLIHI